MSFENKIAQERAKIVLLVNKTKLSKKIGDSILLPILDAIKDNYAEILDDAGNKVVTYLKNSIENFVPSSQNYTVIYIDPDNPPGTKTVYKEPYTASEAGGPPGTWTRELVKAIKYNIDLENGSVKFGLDPNESTGKEFESMSYFPGKIYVDISGRLNTKMSVGEYGTLLDSGYYNREGAFVQRSWFNEPMDNFLREEIRKFIRERLKQVIRSVTRRISVRQSVIFKVYFRQV